MKSSSVSTPTISHARLPTAANGFRMQPDCNVRMAPLVPLQRPGTGAEVGEAIVWLLSDRASYTTGSILEVTGGR